MKGQLPRAYIRIDPNIDQHPDMPLLIRLFCAACRQEPRGEFKTWAHVVTALGRKAAEMARDHAHISEAEGRWIVDGWAHWQEGDLTVGERMRALRERKREKARSVTGTVTQPVTEGVTEPYRNRISPSEASRRQGVKASGNGNGLPAASVQQGFAREPETAAAAGSGRPANPLLAGRRPEIEREVLALVERIAQATGADPIEVLDQGASWEGQKRRGATNPAAMSDDRLSATLLDLRDTWRQIEQQQQAGKRASVADITAARRQQREQMRDAQ